MNLESLKSPAGFLKLMLGDLPDEAVFREYEAWWEAEGKEISASVDRAGTPGSGCSTFSGSGSMKSSIHLPIGRC